jgi:hypothetical protein
VQIDEEVAARCKYLRIRYDDYGVICRVYRDEVTDEVYYQRTDGSVPHVEEYIDPNVKQVGLCELQLHSRESVPEPRIQSGGPAAEWRPPRDSPTQQIYLLPLQSRLK